METNGTQQMDRAVARDAAADLVDRIIAELGIDVDSVGGRQFLAGAAVAEMQRGDVAGAEAEIRRFIGMAGKKVAGAGSIDAAYRRNRGSAADAMRRQGR